MKFVGDCPLLLKVPEDPQSIKTSPFNIFRKSASLSDACDLQLYAHFPSSNKQVTGNLKKIF